MFTGFQPFFTCSKTPEPLRLGKAKKTTLAVPHAEEHFMTRLCRVFPETPVNTKLGSMSDFWAMVIVSSEIYGYFSKSPFLGILGSAGNA